jgi:serine/threonine-protein kinase
MSRGICLDETAVLQLLGGSLSGPRRGDLLEHIEACASCRELVTAVARSSAAAVPRLGVDGSSADLATGPGAREHPDLTPAGDQGVSRETGSSPSSRAGTVVGHHRIGRFIGEGGMGRVWAATNTRTGEEVALKFLKAETQELRSRLLREARILATLRHPHVVQVHDVIEVDGAPVMVMELLHGESLAARLARTRVLSLPEVCQVLRPVASALAAAHERGVIHRDLKPHNIFLRTAGGEGPGVKVLDFGLAKRMMIQGDPSGSASLTTSGTIVGTPYYMAPEQVFGHKGIDHRADIWSLGVICYECLSGRKPFEGDSAGQVIYSMTTTDPPRLEEVTPGLPEEVTRLVHRMLSREPEARPQSVTEVAHCLARWEMARAPGRGGSSPRTLPRTRWRALIVIGVLAGGVAVFYGVSRGPGHPPASRALAPSVAPPSQPDRGTASIGDAGARKATLLPGDAGEHAVSRSLAPSGHRRSAPSATPRRPRGPHRTPVDPAESSPGKKLPGGVYGDSPY